MAGEAVLVYADGSKTAPISRVLPVVTTTPPASRPPANDFNWHIEGVLDQCANNQRRVSARRSSYQDDLRHHKSRSITVVSQHRRKWTKMNGMDEWRNNRNRNGLDRWNGMEQRLEWMETESTDRGISLQKASPLQDRLAKAQAMFAERLQRRRARRSLPHGGQRRGR